MKLSLHNLGEGGVWEDCLREERGPNLQNLQMNEKYLRFNEG